MKTTIDMAREVYGAHTEWTGAPLDRLEQLVALVRADQRESFIAEMQAQIDHAVMNDLRLTPNFGKQKGDLAVRVGSIEAALDAIRNRGNK